MSQLLLKYVGETITVTWNFLQYLQIGETLSTAEVIVSLNSGEDISINLMLPEAATISGTVVSQKITSGVPGAVYNLRCQVVTSGGDTKSLVSILSVRANTGDAAPPLLPLTLSGDLPDGEVGVPYSHTLAITGGVPPYVDVRTVAGIAPGWIIDNISGTNALYTGLPDAPGIFTFTTEVVDYAGFRARSVQTIRVFESILVTGNLPDGIIGDVVNFTYTIIGGTPPYSVNISSGALPTGTSINNDLEVSGTYTATGSYSWNIHVTDTAIGVYDHPDSNIVYAYPALLTGTDRYDGPVTAMTRTSSVSFTIGGIQKITSSLDGIYAVAASASSTPKVQIAKYSGGVYSNLPDSVDYPTEDTRGADISPDGVWLALASASGASGFLRIYKRTGDVFALTDTKTGDETWDCAWSPDGMSIAWIQREAAPEYGICVYTLDQNTGLLGSQRLGAGPATGFFGQKRIAWSPDGNYILIGGSSAIVIYDATGGGSLPVVINYSTASAGYHGSSVAASWDSSGLYIYSVGASMISGAIVGSYLFNASTPSLTRMTNPTQPTGTTLNASSINSQRNALAIAQSGDPGNSVFLYTLASGVMTAVSPLLSTPTDASIAIAWSKVP